jgi:hypothetical protein
VRRSQRKKPFDNVVVWSDDVLTPYPRRQWPCFLWGAQREPQNRTTVRTLTPQQLQKPLRLLQGRQLLKLTEAGLAKLGHAVQTAPALWQSLQ